VPTFRIGAFDILGRQARIQCAMETRLFRHAHEEARLARKAGDMEAVFPYGTYGMRVHHNAPVESAPFPGALVTQPGPTLDDIMTELHMERGMPLTDEAMSLLHDVREAFAEEATELCEDAVLDFASIGNSATALNAPQANGSGEGADGDQPVIVRHRFDKRGADYHNARRIITLRDKRRGRPPATQSNRGGADPPV
jgi:hypothetical protein